MMTEFRQAWCGITRRAFAAEVVKQCHWDIEGMITAPIVSIRSVKIFLSNDSVDKGLEYSFSYKKYTRKGMSLAPLPLWCIVLGVKIDILNDRLFNITQASK